MHLLTDWYSFYKPTICHFHTFTHAGRFGPSTNLKPDHYWVYHLIFLFIVVMVLAINNLANLLTLVRTTWPAWIVEFSRHNSLVGLRIDTDG